MTEKERRAVDSKEVSSWTYDIPFQYVWREAVMFSWRIEPERVASYTEGNLDTKCRVTIKTECDEAGQSSVQLVAYDLSTTCPFCEEGGWQHLRSQNWVSIHDWSEQELGAEFATEEEYRKSHEMEMWAWETEGFDYGLNKALMHDSIREWALGGLPANDEAPDDDARNAYGIARSQLREALERARSCTTDDSNPSDAPISIETFGIGDHFGGLYRCAHCGGIFIVVYRAGNKKKRNAGPQKLLSFYDEAIDKLVARGQFFQPALPDSTQRRLVPTMSVHVSSEDGLVSVKANVAGHWHELAFDTNRGTIILDGGSCVNDGFDSRKLHENPIVWSGIFGLPEVVKHIADELPSLPADMAFRLGSLEDGLDPWRNLRVLIAANRFVGYPASFYDDMVVDGIKAGDGFDEAYLLWSGLPRDFARIEELYESTGLPDEESLKSMLVNRPMLLLHILHYPDLPFRDPDVLRRFFELPQVWSLISSRAMNCKQSLISNGWRFLADVKGEDTILDFIEHASDDELYDLSFLLDFDMSALSESDITYLRVMRMSAMPHVLNGLKGKVEGESGWAGRDK